MLGIGDLGAVTSYTTPLYTQIGIWHFHSISLFKTPNSVESLVTDYILTTSSQSNFLKLFDLYMICITVKRYAKVVVFFSFCVDFSKSKKKKHDERLLHSTSNL